MPALAFEDSDDENKAPVIQSLTEFSSVAIEPVVVPKAELVIERIPNSFRRGNGYRPDALRQEHGRAGGKSIAELEALERARNNVYGLNKPTGKTATPDSPSIESAIEPSSSLPLNAERMRPLTDEERAVQELMNPTKESVDYTITSIAGNELFVKASIHPEMSSLEDYEAIPVESFGLAMLRGMGYDPDTEKKKEKVREKLRRPDFLGLGASERPEETKNAEELAKKRYQERKEERHYVPVVKINKRTGAVVKEESESAAYNKTKNAVDREMKKEDASDRQISPHMRTETKSSRSHHGRERGSAERGNGRRDRDDRSDRYRDRSHSPRRESLSERARRKDRERSHRRRDRRSRSR